MPEEVFIIIVTFMVLGVPILGLTARMVIKTIADTFGSRKGDERALTMRDQRLLRLEEEVDMLRKTVDRLDEAEAFRRALDEPKNPNQALPPGAS